MGDGMTVLVAVLGSSAFSIVVKEIIDSRKARKHGENNVGTQIQRISERIDEMDKKLDEKIDALDKKLDSQRDTVEKQHLDVLRLTIMSPNMPVSERLIAGAEYIKKGGNGDVKKYVHDLEKQCQNGLEKREA